MPNFADLPNELLIKIFRYDVQHHSLEYGNEPGNYLNSILDRKFGRKIYAAAKEAFWQSYVAKTTIKIGEITELDEEAETSRCSPDVDIHEYSGVTMVQQCRNLKVYLLVSVHLSKADYAGYYKEKIVEFVKEVKNIQAIEICMVIRDESIREKAKQLAKEVVQELRGGMDKNIKGVVTDFDMPTREVTMRSAP